MKPLISALALLAATTSSGLAMEASAGTDMLRTSIAQSLRSEGISMSDLANLSVSELVTLHAILGSDESDSQKTSHARTRFEATTR